MKVINNQNSWIKQAKNMTPASGRWVQVCLNRPRRDAATSVTMKVWSRVHVWTTLTGKTHFIYTLCLRTVNRTCGSYLPSGHMWNWHDSYRCFGKCHIDFDQFWLFEFACLKSKSNLYLNVHGDSQRFHSVVDEETQTLYLHTNLTYIYIIYGNYINYNTEQVQFVFKNIMIIMLIQQENVP